MLKDVLTALEKRCRDEAPSLLDDVRTALDLATTQGATFALVDAPDTSAPTLDGGRWDERTEEVATVRAVAAGERYADLGRIGTGGMGEVRRVRDRELDRIVAMKLIHPDRAHGGEALARFVAEARVTAQLQHPGIVPVYDAGRLADGRFYFTMREVRGRTLGEVIREVYAGDGGGGDDGDNGEAVDDPSLRRLVAVLHQASLAVAYAHERGVVHRDLKPANVMVGDFGEVQVMDWGLSKVLGREDRSVEGDTDDTGVGVGVGVGVGEDDLTRVGQVMGTPAYMAPEQARGEVDAIDARTDVYALGAMLYEVLTGRAPYRGPDGRAVVRQVVAGPPEPPSRSRTGTSRTSGEATTGPTDGAVLSAEPDPDLPEELVEACLRAMARDPADRFSTASDLAAELAAWLDGSKRRARALELVGQADDAVPDAAALRERAEALAAEAEQALEAIPLWAPEARKLAAWAKQDEAARLGDRAALKALERDQLLAGALAHTPDLAEAHAALALDQRAAHARAEQSRDRRGAHRAEALLRSHLARLPERDPVRRRCERYLRGTGALTLVTEPHGAEVELLRYEPHGRRLVLRSLGIVGRTPIATLPLEMGSYLCVLRHPERAEVRYPVHIGRGAVWDGVRPGSRAPSPVYLPPPEALDADSCYVPAGPFQAGDAEVMNAYPPRRLWCDGFVIQRFPVTNREYIAFLDDLVAAGREDDALLHAPRERGGTEGALGEVIFGRDDAGRFVLRPDADGDLWLPDEPVAMVAWSGAEAYARWLAARTGLPWRLPWELEWEKAARGVDGRAHPWGDGFDPSYCCMRDSHEGESKPSVVDAFPVDASPYGVRGMGGNVQDWCLDVALRGGAPLPDDIVAPCLGEGERGRLMRVQRGGYWYGTSHHTVSTFRIPNEPTVRSAHLGFRVARPLGPRPGERR